MREEIQKGGAWLWNFNWALRYCESVTEPFVISEAPFVAEGPTADVAAAIKHPNTLLYFLCAGRLVCLGVSDGSIMEQTNLGHMT
jgi:hypothetical protein